MKNSILLIACLIISACAQNPYQKFYTDHGTANFPEKWRPVIKADSDPTNNPRLILIGNQKESTNDALSNGFITIGHSSFYSPVVDDALAINFGKTIGAELITLFKTTKDRVNQEVPTVIPIVTTTNSRFGPSTSVSSVGSSATVGVDRMNYEAIYWFKSKRPSVFGARVKDLTADERKAFGSNKGMKVFTVVKGTPAFASDILIDDILLKLGDTDINSQQDYVDALKKYQGTEVNFVVSRSGKLVDGKSKLNNSED